ncbi:glycosyltransferase [Botrimarina hoheduenensis]|uniref:Glycosyltransferase subfamily 4-like N-terminal domain-containing protein n=1 Tax=Botrimarina hoheduenensis TaxID=2528000 RepID=A0A5C5VV25_9BACT|nr:glycosyltransferase [Botrimarina hoheduenensis]TWT42488.1 hypothetical protein Pla111_27930 [Botrimarina hoheduenensis]
MHVLLVKRDASVAGDTTYLLMLAEGLIGRGHRVSFAAGPGRLASRFRRIGARVWLTPPGPLATPLLKLWARRAGVEAVVTAGRGSLRFAAYTAAEALALPCVVTLQDHIEEGQSIEEFERCAAVVAVEQPIVDRAAALGVPHEKLAVWPRPVFERALGIAPTEGFPILWMNRMSGSKAWSGEALIRAAPEIVRRIPAARITLVGGGSRSRVLRRLARQTNLTIGRQVLRVEGFTLDPLGKMAGAALVVGGGYTALEALYNGRPTLAAGFGYQGPITAADIPAAYDRHFGDRQPGGGSFSRATADELADAVLAVHTARERYKPRRDWFPLDHSLDGQARRLEELLQRVGGMSAYLSNAA